MAATERWTDEWVIALGLCPFAHPVRRAGLIRTVAVPCSEPEAVLSEVIDEMNRLADTPRTELATTLIVLCAGFDEFEDFLDFLGPVDAALEALELVGTLQVATFHPAYRFDGAAPDDVGNATNRSPWPTLHLIREQDISEAVESHPDPDGIPEANIRRLEAMGRAEVARRLSGLGVTD